MADTIYQAKDFEDWYQHHYKTKYDGNNTWTQTFKESDGTEKTIGDYDWQIGQKLYNLYQQDQYYQGEHDRAAADSAQRSTDAKIAADVSRQRLEKYLPQQLAMQGLYGTGMSEDAYLKLQSQYQGAVNAADAQHEANLADYKSTLDAQKLALDTQADEAVQGVMAQKKNDDANSLAVYEEAYAMLDPSMLTSDTDVDEVLVQYKDKMSDVHYANLTRYAQTVKDDIAEIQKQKAKAPGHTAQLTDHDSLGVGDDLTIKINGTPYIVESNGPASNAPALAYAQANISEGNAFAYDGDIYVYSGEQIYKLKSKSNSHENRKAYNTLRHYLLYGEVIEATTGMEPKNNSGTLDNGITYTVQASSLDSYITHRSPLEEEEIINAAKDVPDNAVFTYNGEFYYKKNGNVYRQ